MQLKLSINDQLIEMELPPIFAINEKFRGNSIIQILLPQRFTRGIIQDYKKGRIRGYIFTPEDDRDNPILIITNSSQPPENENLCIRMKDKIANTTSILSLNTSKAQWIRHPFLVNIPEDPIDYSSQIDNVISSWDKSFNFLEEDLENNIPGLRSPQIGSIHAVHAHWSVSKDEATVVMPTGIGKTETMLSLLISKCSHRLLVIVPTDALRTQIAEKFISLGVLKEFGIVEAKSNYPIVGILKHRPSNTEEVDKFFEKCNVVVTTMSIAGLCKGVIQERFAYHCQYLFIDEAHHVSAKTWNEFKSKFKDSRILQFTATPFREDGKSIGGKIIYNFPLQKAQEEGYFRPITFRSVVEYDPQKHDSAIAEAAINQLREDYDKGHILMARVATIDRAKKVFQIYNQYQEFNPVEIHSGLKQSERNRIRQKIIGGEARIVVCVDMLGEGFDLPELKIAAFHDIRKSLPVTLQLAGRFTRTRSDLGDPTFIANIAEVDVQDELRLLYTQDPDWNLLLPQASKAAIEEEENLWEFLKDFKNFPEDITLLNLRPAMSTVVYKTSCDEWTPQNYCEGIKKLSSYDHVYHDINQVTKTLVIVTNKRVLVDWAHMEEIFTFNWELFIAIWDKEQNLLFINGSSNTGYYKDLAKAIAGDDVELIRGAPIFRCFDGVNRLRLQNVGLLKTLGRLIRYEMRAGSDVEPGLTEAQRRNTTKSNLFGAGFELGQKTSIGCSYKGRIWSRRTANLYTLSEWCSNIGRKLLDKRIDPEEVLRGTLVPKGVKERPRIIPIAIEWPDIVYRETESAFSFSTDGLSYPFHNTDINLVAPSENEDIKFELSSENVAIQFTLSILENGEYGDFGIHQDSTEEAVIEFRTQAIRAEEFFQEYPPIIWFSDGSSLVGNSYIEINQEYLPYPLEKIETWDWTGIDIRKESQGIEKATDSIQYKVIETLMQNSYDLIIDDDDSGESADIVAIQVRNNLMRVDLYHCKYSGGNQPGGRINDLYEVCGQAQKSIHWVEKPINLFYHLQKREPRNFHDTEFSRFEKGNIDTLVRLLEMSRKMKVEFKIFIVQPGLSQASATKSQLELLSVTENYLKETYMIPFGVIASP